MEETLRKYFANRKLQLETYLRANGGREAPNTGSFFASPAFHQLNADCAGLLTDKERAQRGELALLLSVGVDGVQLLNWGARTATVVGLKLEEGPEDQVQKAAAVAPLLVIEGPQEPSKLAPALDKVTDFFVKHAPSTNGKSAHLIMMFVFERAVYMKSGIGLRMWAAGADVHASRMISVHARLQV